MLRIKLLLTFSYISIVVSERLGRFSQKLLLYEQQNMQTKSGGGGGSKTLDFALNKLIIVMKILGGGGGDLGFGGISQSRHFCMNP